MQKYCSQADVPQVHMKTPSAASGTMRCAKIMELTQTELHAHVQHQLRATTDNASPCVPELLPTSLQELQTLCSTKANYIQA